MNTLHPACRIILVIGPKNSGKTSYLRTIQDRAHHRGLTVGGFLSVSPGNMLNKKNYLLHAIQTGQEELLASTTPRFGQAIQYCEYYFNPKIFDLGNQILMNSIQSNMIILDEFGPLEKQQTGFYPGFNFLLKHYKGILIIALRPRLQSYLRNIISGQQ